jgi:mersacidin/lichenicidin family type 2 lantibiotic
MNTRNIIRAWKDEEYRLSLSEAERALLPEHPAGLIELGDADLEAAAGGRGIVSVLPETCPQPSVDGPCQSQRKCNSFPFCKPPPPKPRAPRLLS